MKGGGAEGRTLRREILELLAQGEWDFEDLRRFLDLPVRVLDEELEHVERTARREGRRLKVQPAVCSDCGFALKKRRRFSTPGRCPVCRGERLSPPRLHLA